MEFSQDNCSQLICLSEGGFLSSFLIKGYMPPSKYKSVYFDEKNIVMMEDAPMLLIPYFNINFNHFLTPASEQLVGSQEFQITSAAFNPSISFIGFQSSITVGTENGLIMRWNSNISLDKMQHVDDVQLYSKIFGNFVMLKDHPYPENSATAAEISLQ
mmetsp:Transcript_40298/g.61497  ORF Transcript_40298/g.61497 Transcript_40298/m.61497 type:complete len:158 (-) Transcript_40298:175-648(-)